jgi:hypothetical protein
LFSWALRGVPFTEEVIRIRSSKKWRLYFGIRAVLLRDKRKVGRLVLRVNGFAPSAAYNILAI